MATELMIDMAARSDEELARNRGIQPSPLRSLEIVGETDEAPDPVMQGCGSRWFRRRQPDGWEELLDILGLPQGGPLTPWPDNLDSRAAQACLAEARQDQARIEAAAEDERESAEIAARLAAYARKPLRQTPKPRPDWAWSQDAACKPADLVLFFDVDGETEFARDHRERLAKTICDGCPARVRCLNFALARREKGVWGGLNDEERNRERRRRQRRPDRAEVA